LQEKPKSFRKTASGKLIIIGLVLIGLSPIMYIIYLNAFESPLYEIFRYEGFLLFREWGTGQPFWEEEPWFLRFFVPGIVVFLSGLTLFVIKKIR